MRDKKGRYKKGHIPHNLGINEPTSDKCAETYFTPAHCGDKHSSWKGGTQKMGKDCAYLWAGSKKRIRRPRAIWENKYGKIPTGLCIWHIDGDKDNDDIDNLEIVTRGDMMRRNSNN